MKTKTGKWLLGFLAAGMMAGIFAAFFWRGYYLDEFKHMQERLLISLDEKLYSRVSLFMFLLWQRIKQAVFLVFLFWGLGVSLLYAASAVIGFAGGFYLFAVCTRFGISGIVVFLGSFFPQFFFYLPALFFLMKFGRTGGQSSPPYKHTKRVCAKTATKAAGKIGLLLLAILFFLLGCFSETCIQPPILYRLLKLL